MSGIVAALLPVIPKHCSHTGKVTLLSGLHKCIYRTCRHILYTAWAFSYLGSVSKLWKYHETRVNTHTPNMLACTQRYTHTHTQAHSLLWPLRVCMLRCLFQQQLSHFSDEQLSLHWLCMCTVHHQRTNRIWLPLPNHLNQSKSAAEIPTLNTV